MAVTGVEFPSDVNEFEKAGVTMLPSDIVKPFRVKESPVHLSAKSAILFLWVMAEEQGI